MRNGMRKALLLLAAVCMLFAGAAARADTMHREIENESFDMEVSVGYDGVMTYGKVMPVRVRIRNFGQDFEGVLGMNAYVSANEYDRYEKEIFVPAGSEREYEIAVTVYSKQEKYTAELARNGEIVCAATAKPVKTVNPSAMLIGVLSTRPQNLNNLNIDRENDTLGRYELWQTVALTAENFPEDAAALRSFAMIVVDDIAPDRLSDRQQELLAAWLKNGRVILCGGGSNAARNIPFFSDLTGLKLERTAASGSVRDGLEALINRSAGGKELQTTIAELSGAEPLARDAEGHGLIWRTKAENGRIYTTAFEAGDVRLNSVNLMHYFWQQLLVDQDQDVYSSMMYTDTESFASAAVNAGYAVPVTAQSRLLPGLLIMAGALVLCCAGWLVLKRKDKRQWMWAVMPAVSAAAIACITLLAGGAETNRPMAVITENLIQDNSGAIRSYGGIDVAVPDFGRHQYRSGGENLRVQMYDYVDYDDEEAERKTEPDRLRTSYLAGGESAITVESSEPWEKFGFTTDGPAQVQGRIDGSIWMEEDGLHGEVENGTDLKLAPGYVITSFGYVSVPALFPGERTSFVMTRKKFDDPKDPKYDDGRLYLENPNLYSAVSGAVGYSDENRSDGGKEAQDREMAHAMINGATDQLRHMADRWSNYGNYEAAVFVYSAGVEDAKEMTLSVDGVPVERKTGKVMLHAALTFAAMGRTGVVFRSAGMDIPVLMDIDENMIPAGVSAQNGKQLYYHSLTDIPTFRFTLEGMENVEIEKLQVQMDSYYQNQARAYAWNIVSHAWDEIRLNRDIERPGQYVDSEGQLYLQFRPDSNDMYADIPTPMITLEGRAENAAD